MKYVRIHTRGHWLVTVHTIDSAGGIATHCGRKLAGFQAQVELTTKKPDGRICQQCRNATEAEQCPSAN